jgi:hypothetical protein
MFLMTAKTASRTLAVIVAVVAVLGGGDYVKEVYYRATLTSNLKPLLGDLTVQSVIGRCGPPEGQYRELFFREVSYRRSGTSIRFIRTGTADASWAFTSFHEWFGPGKPRKDPRQVLESMPCLDPAAAILAH